MAQRMVILGAGTALPDRDRDNTFLLWDSPAGSLLIDCGGRAYQQVLRAGVDPRAVRATLLTHNHPDHIYGVPAFLFHLWLADYPHDFEVYANASTLRMAQALCDALELPQAQHMVPTHWHELDAAPETLVFENELYSVYTTPVRHTRPTLAMKFVDHERERALAYSADTEPCPEFERFAQGAHTLIHEATIANGPETHGHTTPHQVGEIAARCGVERVVLIHYSADYTMPEAQAIAEVKASGFEGEVRLARELESYEL